MRCQTAAANLRKPARNNFSVNECNLQCKLFLKEGAFLQMIMQMMAAAGKSVKTD